ncbi:LIM homeobox transcription factor 1-beta isoform X1 [Chironomus tepperi]|uniref:LIM homeobox transcription factor 1-beta isoform X1 n=1 Tax=Chironomus tepperi TaxID=113505 RepID=UPI00391F90DD
MLDFYQNLNIHSGMISDIESDKTLTCGSSELTATIKCEKVYEICEGCSQKIYDRYYLNVADKSWHESCLTCNICNLLLNYKCYVRNSKLYCKDDYYRIYGTKCVRCCEKITPDEMVMKIQNSYIYHVNCFTCCSCNQPLQKGEQFAFRGGQLLCRADFEKESFLPQPYDDDYVIEEHHVRSRDGRRGPKRPRTILTSSQRRQFKASFDVSPKPCRKVREALAKDTGLSVRVVQVWFQNQRAKCKKIQRKSKSGDDKGSDKEKDDKIKQESPDSDYILDNSYGQPLNPNLPFSPDDYPAHSNDSICSSDISLDGSNFDHLDDASDTVSLHNLNLSSHHLQIDQLNINNNNNLSTTANLMTHIDKLYQMQSSYFIGASIEQ